MWREFIRDFTPNCQFFDPASPAELAELEGALEVSLPADLRLLLEETNGVHIAPAFPDFAEEDEAVVSLIWSAEEIFAENLNLRAFEAEEGADRGFEPLSPLLFFANEPNGDFLASVLNDGNHEFVEPTVIRMSHENYNQRTVAAPSLRDYLNQFLEFVAAHENQLQAG